MSTSSGQTSNARWSLDKGEPEALVPSVNDLPSTGSQTAENLTKQMFGIGQASAPMNEDRPSGPTAVAGLDSGANAAASHADMTDGIHETARPLQGDKTRDANNGTGITEKAKELFSVGRAAGATNEDRPQGVTAAAGLDSGANTASVHSEMTDGIHETARPLQGDKTSDVHNGTGITEKAKELFGLGRASGSANEDRPQGPTAAAGLDAGATAATGHADLTDGIHESATAPLGRGPDGSGSHYIAEAARQSES